MAILSATGSGLAGIQQGFQKVTQAAESVAKANDSANPGSALTRSAVELLQGKQQVQASAKVIETEKEIMGTLLDVRV